VVTPGPRLTDEQVEELLGAYALDACEPGEVDAIEAVLSRRPDLRREADRLSGVATWIGTTEAPEPPAAVRARVIRRARAGRDAVIDLYRTQSERFAEAVSLVHDALDNVTTNGLTARDLVIHEAAQESLLAQAVGRSPIPAIDETDIDARTASFVRHLEGRALDDIVTLWQAAVEANCAWASSEGAGSATWRGLDLARDDAIIVRAFETWIHADDLRRVVGLPDVPPEPDQLALMADLAGRTLSLSLALTGRTHAGRTARLVLTGDGGGDWLVAMDGSGPGTGRPDVTLAADVVDWCLLVGDRLAPADLHCTIDGDAQLSGDLLAAAPALATL
jgi:uncharacterized protein (TIGR03083 family)